MEHKKPPYEPPMISRIKLIVEESLLTVCKVSMADTAGTSGLGCFGGGCNKDQAS